MGDSRVPAVTAFSSEFQIYSPCTSSIGDKISDVEFAVIRTQVSYELHEGNIQRREADDNPSKMSVPIHIETRT